MGEAFYALLPNFCFFISSQGKVLWGLFSTGFFLFGRQKKVVAGCLRQVVVFYRNNCMGIHVGRLSIGRLRRVVI